MNNVITSRRSKRFIRKLAKSHPLAFKAIVLTASAYGTYKAVNYGYGKLRPTRDSKSPSDPIVRETTTTKRKVDKEYIYKLLKLVNIILPRVWSKEFAFLFLHSVALITRAFLSIYVSVLDGRLAKSIVEKNLYKFMYLLLQWVGIAIPATFINSALKYLEGKVSLAFRTRLVEYSYKLYFAKQTYYKVGNLDSRLPAPDESLTEDIRLFCDSIAHLYSHMTKPCLDIILVCVTLNRLAKKRGESWVKPVCIGTLVSVLTGHVLKQFSPAFGKLVAEQSARRGILRTIHSRIITNSEEIAFYGGHKVLLSSFVVVYVYY